jgi:hypothetical protein
MGIMNDIKNKFSDKDETEALRKDLRKRMEEITKKVKETSYAEYDSWRTAKEDYVNVDEKVKVPLTSLDPEKYPDIVKEFTIIGYPEEQLNEYADCRTQNGEKKEPIMSKKEAKVTARLAKLGETIHTGPIVEIDGKKYRFEEAATLITQEMMDAGAMVIRNPDGEFYFNKSSEKFEKQYVPIQSGGEMAEYTAEGPAKPFYRLKEDVILAKPDWGDGAFQVGNEGSYACVEEKPYVVTNSAAEVTYPELAEDFKRQKALQEQNNQTMMGWDFFN